MNVLLQDVIPGLIAVLVDHSLKATVTVWPFWTMFITTESNIMMWLVTIQNQPSVNAHKKNWIYLFIASLPSKYLPIYLLVITLILEYNNFLLWLESIFWPEKRHRWWALTGHLISKSLLSVFNSPKKWMKTNRLELS